MADNDWLMVTAIEKGCVLQYTGVENAREVQNIVRKLRAAGKNEYATLWGENAGYEVPGRNPIWLAEVSTAYGLRGVDLTWSNWLFARDGVTPNATFQEFAYAARMIRTFSATGRRLRPLLPSDAARSTSPKIWTVGCVASTRLFSSFPAAIQGGDPEIAAVEGVQTQRILLQFALDALPKGSSIRHALLVMRRSPLHDEDLRPATLAIYRVTQPWVAVGASWEEAMPGVPWARPGGAAADREGRLYAPDAKTHPWASVAVPPCKTLGDVVEWDVTNLVGKLVEGPNHGLMIVALGREKINKAFASRGHPDREMRPVLKVEIAVPENCIPHRRLREEDHCSRHPI
jgi:hypothetical protein